MLKSSKAIFLILTVVLFHSLVPFTSARPGDAQPNVQPGDAQPNVQQGVAPELGNVEEGQGQGDFVEPPKTGPAQGGPDPSGDSKISIHFTDKVTLDVMNGLPANSPPLIVHCKSKDNDFGNHTLNRWEYFYWRFYPGFIRSTLYWCHWYWGSKVAKFDVYDNKGGKGEGQCRVGYPDKEETHVCHWQAREDGFYWTKYLGIGQQQNNPGWEKRYDWAIY